MKLIFETLFIAALTIGVISMACTKPAPEVKVETKVTSTPSSAPAAVNTPQPVSSPSKKDDKKPDPNGK